MRLSSRTHYGIRVLADLAAAWESGPLSVSTLAAGEGISEKYLEQIMARLKSAGVVVAVRAKGYRLSGPPGRFRLSTAVWALEGSRTLRPCVIAADACPRRRTCPARPVWRRMEIALHTCLSRLTLASLLRGRYRADRIAAIRGWRQPRACRSHRHMFG